MFCNTDILTELARSRCTELLKEAEDERQAKKVIRMQKQQRRQSPLYLFTRVTSEIEIETTQFGSYYLTYYRSPHRVAALERYTTEAAARAGHHKWAGKNWSKRSFSEVVLEEAT